MVASLSAIQMRVIAISFTPPAGRSGSNTESCFSLAPDGGRESSLWRLRVVAGRFFRFSGSIGSDEHRRTMDDWG